MAEKMTQMERMAKAREMAVESLTLPEKKWQVGVATWVVETESGLVKVAFTAVKDTEYDPAEEQAQYEYEKAEAKAKADKRKAEADAKKAADVAKKAKAKADKGE